jgi:DnaJ family protein C protein 2
MTLSIKVSLPAAWKDPAPIAGCEAPLPAPITRCFEACGEWIENSLRAADLVRQFTENKGTGSPTDKGPKADGSSPAGGARKKKRGAGVKLSEEDFAEDWYGVLKLEQQESATDDDIRLAYRRRCLETHPDKQPNNSDVEFKKVQRAFEILSDPDTRVAFDSSRTFDDTIPPEEVDESKFYKLFNPCFERNKKWSVVENLPSLGDDNTPLDQVKAFYDAWYRYRSWRDFSHEVELEDIDEGMQREEKRFYQRENQRLLDKCMRDEMKRIRSLVDRAYKNDPRLCRKRAAEEAEQERIREERRKERERLREEEERRKAEESEKERLAQAEKLAQIKAEKERAKTLRNQLQELFESNSLLDTVSTNLLLVDKVRVPNIAWICSKSTNDALQSLLDDLKSKSPAAGSVPADAAFASTGASDSSSATPTAGVEMVVAFNNAILQKESETGYNRYGEACKKIVKTEAKTAKSGSTASSSSSTLWSEDDIILLTKAIAKFPGGTVERWRRIGSMLPPNKFTEEQILQKTKEVESGWKEDKSLKKQKAPTLGGITPPPDATESAPSTLDAPEDLANDPRGRLVRMLEKYCPEKLGNTTKILEQYKGKEEELFAAMVKKYGPEPPLNQKKLPTATAGPAGAPAAMAKGDDDGSSVEDWTVKQQKQLETGLRELQGYKEKDKFIKIAAGVEGKTAKQCYERFKYLASLNKK